MTAAVALAGMLATRRSAQALAGTNAYYAPGQVNVLVVDHTGRPAQVFVTMSGYDTSNVALQSPARQFTDLNGWVTFKYGIRAGIGIYSANFQIAYPRAKAPIASHSLRLDSCVPISGSPACQFKYNESYKLTLP